MTDVLAAEWVKLRSVRSTYIVLAVVVFAVLFGALMTWYGVVGWERIPPDRRFNFQATPLEQALLPVVQLCLAVLGTLAITSEYATGMIRTSLTVVPRRRAMLASKATIVGVLALLAGELTMFVMFYVSRLIVNGRPWPNYTSPPAQETPRLIAAGLSVMVVALVGLGLGTALRSTTGAITTVCALLLVIPIFTGLLPDPWGGRISAVMLPNLPGQFAHGSHVLSPAGALAAMAGYVMAALAAATVVITRWDA
jgi:ABC-2 type transport system permease protein